MKDGCVWIVTVQNIKLYAFQNKCVGLLEIQKCIPKSLVALKEGHQSNFLQLQNICNKSVAPYFYVIDSCMPAVTPRSVCVCILRPSPWVAEYEPESSWRSFWFWLLCNTRICRTIFWAVWVKLIGEGFLCLFGFSLARLSTSCLVFAVRSSLWPDDGPVAVSSCV